MKQFALVVVTVLSTAFVLGLFDDDDSVLPAEVVERAEKVDSALADAAMSDARADSAAAVAVKATQALEDSVALWKVERKRLTGVVVRERTHHASLAGSLRARVDSATALIVDDMEAANAAQADAYEAQIATFKAENAELRRINSALNSQIVDLRDEVSSLTTALLETQAINAVLQKKIEDSGMSKVHKVGDAVAYGSFALNVVESLVGGVG